VQVIGAQCGVERAELVGTTLHKVSNPVLMPLELLPRALHGFRGVVKLIRETVLAVRGHRCEMVFYIPSKRGPSPTGIIREVVCVSGRLGARLAGLITNLS
jgi:hypothetical protein